MISVALVTSLIIQGMMNREESDLFWEKYVIVPWWTHNPPDTHVEVTPLVVTHNYSDIVNEKGNSV
jgi:hypothetical protein